MKAPRLLRRDPAAPSLRERAAALKASAARLIRRPTDDADPQRRAIMAGTFAAAVTAPMAACAAGAPAFAEVATIPALTTTAASALIDVVPGPHPDQALFDAQTEMDHANEVLTAARTASRIASAAFERAVGRAPEALVMSAWERQCIAGCTPGLAIFGRVRTLFGDRLDPKRHWAGTHRIWTAEALQHVIDRAVDVLGRGGRTPHLIRRWRALLPLATAHDERRAFLKGRFRVDERHAQLREAEAACHQASTRFGMLTATTREGLALKVQYLADTPWRSMTPSWATLLESAAAVAGVALSVPGFDVAAWAEAYKAAGGEIIWHAGLAEWEFRDDRNDPLCTKETVRTLSGLRSELDQHKLTIRRWLTANRPA